MPGRMTIAILFAVGLFSQQSALAQYPTKPVHIVVPYPPGGAVDAFARVLSQSLSDAWGQQVVVDNRPGASTMIGAEQVAKSPADGYTLLLTAELTLVTVPHLYEKISYDPLRDFAPITALVSATQALVVNPSLPVKTVRDLVALAKAKPGELTYGSFGIGSTGHLNMEDAPGDDRRALQSHSLQRSGPAMNDVIGGHIRLHVCRAQYRQRQCAGRETAYDRRRKQSPQQRISRRAHTFGVGRAGFEAKSWFGLVAPAGTPPDIIKKINQDVTKVISDRAFAEKYLAAQGLEPIIGTPEQFAAFIRAETVKWGKIVKDANIKVTK